MGTSWSVADIPSNTTKAYVVLAVLSVIVHLRSFSEYRHVEAENLSAVLIVLILGAFFQGLGPSIGSARGTPTQWLLYLSYNRWSMEAITIHEGKHYIGDAPNAIVLMYAKYGICNLDEEVKHDGE
ncbi:hypothetical protein GPECTOR_72g608 [Gonium pectorale]|uniref:ABC-2 type transporter domain-containing protein n=1 Tax=Gonium pectorale TaxID=33097 RepID=A0A150G2Z6_GONPE|nr:hypothetical protein GPECTOR_72g608 [Gonium pectorale]|eukprot:KXZ44161.1 hypothetical protein GPECTOR_72g608 [Gonium pectorale]